MKNSGFQKFLNKLGIERVDENDPFEFGDFSAEDIESDYQEDFAENYLDDSMSFYENLSDEASEILTQEEEPQQEAADDQEVLYEEEQAPEEEITEETFLMPEEDETVPEEEIIQDAEPEAAAEDEKDDLISDIMSDWENNNAPMKNSGSGRNLFKWTSRIRRPMKMEQPEEEAPIDEKRQKAMQEAAAAAEVIEQEMMRAEAISNEPEAELEKLEEEAMEELKAEVARQKEEKQPKPEPEEEKEPHVSLRSAEVTEPKNANGVVVALGMFDGVHIGHQHLMAIARKDADRLGIPLNVVTFYEHPASVLTGNKIPYLTTLEERMALLTKYGMDCLNLYHFTNRFASMHYREFLFLLIRELGMTHMVIGQNAIFGRGGLGNAQTIQEEAEHFGITVHIVPAVTANGKRISSSSIRDAAQRGDMPFVNTCLTRPYALTGNVQKGAERGRLLGFPTANIAVPQNMVLPGNGVYVTRVSIDGGPLQEAVTNIGYHPTVDKLDVPIIESHLLDFSGDLYGKQLRVEFMKMLRPEQVFETFSELSAQIAEDKKAAADYFETHPIKKD